MTVSRYLARPPDELPLDGGRRHVWAFLERDVHICTRLLDEAQRLVRMGQDGPVLVQFVRRARQILDEMQELLVAASPAQDAALFKRITQLHETIESVQSSMRTTRQNREDGPPAGGERNLA